MPEVARLRERDTANWFRVADFKEPGAREVAVLREASAPQV